MGSGKSTELGVACALLDAAGYVVGHGLLNHYEAVRTLATIPARMPALDVLSSVLAYRAGVDLGPISSRNS